MKPEVIIFDLDDTLVPDEANVELALGVTCEPAARRYGIDVVAFVQTVRREARALWKASPTYEYYRRVGMASWEGLWIEYYGNDPQVAELRDWTPTYRVQAWQNALTALGIYDTVLAEKLAEQFPRERRKRHQPYDDVFDVIKTLKDRYRLALLTNGAVDLQTEKLEASGLAPYFDVVTVSGEIGIGKPDPRVFLLTLERLGVEASACVMVGNSLHSDVGGAKNVDMTAIWVNRDGQQADSSSQPDFEVAGLTELEAVLDSL